METQERCLLCNTTFFLHIQPLKQTGCAPGFMTNQPEEDMEPFRVQCVQLEISTDYEEEPEPSISFLVRTLRSISLKLLF